MHKTTLYAKVIAAIGAISFIGIVHTVYAWWSSSIRVRPVYYTAAYGYMEEPNYCQDSFICHGERSDNGIELVYHSAPNTATLSLHRYEIGTLCFPTWKNKLAVSRFLQ